MSKSFNKSLLPLVITAIVLLIAVPMSLRWFREKRQQKIDLQAIDIAADLEATTNSPALVWMSPELKKALAQFLTTPKTYVSQHQRGDAAPPLGNGTATHRLYLKNGKEEYIAIRLRYDPMLSKFQVLSFWHPASF